MNKLRRYAAICSGEAGPGAAGANRSPREEGADERPELVGALHDLGVAGGGQDGEPAVGEEVEHLGGMVEADEVAVADHEERGGGDRPDLVGGPAGEVVDDRLHALEEREEVAGFGATAS